VGKNMCSMRVCV